MARETTLFEKLRNPEKKADRRIHENTDMLAESVLNYLRRMLNSRQGHALILPDFGMPDFTSLINTLPDTIHGLEAEIKKTIESYEPRLNNVMVIHRPMKNLDMTLQFEVTAELATADEEASILFETYVNASGHIQIKG